MDTVLQLSPATEDAFECIPPSLRAKLEADLERVLRDEAEEEHARAGQGRAQPQDRPRVGALVAV